MKRIFTAILFMFLVNGSFAQLLKFKYRVPQAGNYHWINVVNDSNIYAIKFLAGGEVQHYNGFIWKSYKRTNYPWILEAEVSENGKIWLGTIAGLYLIDTFQTHPGVDEIPYTVNGYQITDSVTQLTGANGKLWFTTNKYLACINNNVLSITHKDTSPFLADLPKVSDLILAQNGNVLLATPNGIVEFNGYNHRRLMTGQSIVRFHKDAKGEIWFTQSNSNTLYRWNNGQPVMITSSSCNSLLKAGAISSNENGDLFIWDGGEDNGVNRFKKSLYGIYSTNEQRFYSTKNYSGPAINGYLFVDTKKELFAINYTADSVFEFNVDSVKNMLNAWDKYTTNLDANNVRMPIISDALFGWNLDRGSTNFPKQTCKTMVFTGSLWLGGMENDNQKVAAQTYRQSGWDYYPGPIQKPAGQLVFEKQPLEKSAYYKPRKVTKAAIDKFRTDFAAGGPIIIPPEILNWPAHGDTTKGEAFYLAPFVDVNQDGMYNPYQGDYPNIKGDMAVYNIIHDYTLHSESQGKPFGIEIHLMAYAYACADIPANSPNQALNNTVFFQYRIINRSDTNYQSIKPGVFLDVDIGNYDDDHVACNPKVGYAYGFNGDAFDESYPGYDNGYGNRPATISVVPLGQDSNTSYLRGMVYYNNDFSRTGNPSRVEHYSSYLNARFKDNSPITYGGMGNDTTSTPTMYMFPGDDDLQGRPHWSMKSAGIPPKDMRMVSLLTPFNLNAGSDTTFTVALLASLPIDSASTYQTIKNDVLRVKGWFAANSFPTCGKLISGVHDVQRMTTDVIVYPNPATQTIQVKHNLGKQARLEIWSIDGKMLWQGYTEGHTDINVTSFASGLYLMRVVSEQGSKTVKWVKE